MKSFDLRKAFEVPSYKNSFFSDKNLVPEPPVQDEEGHSGEGTGLLGLLLRAEACPGPAQGGRGRSRFLSPSQS